MICECCFYQSIEERFPSIPHPSCDLIELMNEVDIDDYWMNDGRIIEKRWVVKIEGGKCEIENFIKINLNSISHSFPIHLIYHHQSISSLTSFGSIQNPFSSLNKVDERWDGLKVGSWDDKYEILIEEEEEEIELSNIIWGAKNRNWRKN